MAAFCHSNPEIHAVLSFRVLSISPKDARAYRMYLREKLDIRLEQVRNYILDQYK